MNDKANILIVDDEEVVRLSHLRSLRGADCNARAAEDGRQALQVMEQDPFDVVLLDLRMPGLDGMDVLKTIKQRWPKSEVVIVDNASTDDTPGYVRRTFPSVRVIETGENLGFARANNRCAAETTHRASPTSARARASSRASSRR